MNPDRSKVEAFAGQVVTDIAAAFSGVMTNIGHKLGLYKAMAGAGWMSSDQLAEKTGTEERYVREWLNNQAAGGYVEYDPKTRGYNMPDEHIPVLADDDSPVFLVPALEVASSLWMDEGRVTDVFRTGDGIAWSDHHHRLFCGSESLFRPGYKAHLATGWIAALEGVSEKLAAGAKLADVGCGHGASTIVMAQAFPNSTVIGFDYHESSIETARQRAKEAGMNGRTRFEVASAKGYEEREFDLICFMDCLHDMGDPAGAARHARKREGRAQQCRAQPTPLAGRVHTDQRQIPMRLGGMHFAHRLENSEHLGVALRRDGVSDHRGQRLFVGFAAWRVPERTGREVRAVPGGTKLERTSAESLCKDRIMPEIAVRSRIQPADRRIIDERCGQRGQQPCLVAGVSDPDPASGMAGARLAIECLSV
jgi:2-polyprenyl-3-methyl-5-hydroxy-6-metoxy-1,4-benzoquinol methylase